MQEFIGPVESQHIKATSVLQLFAAAEDRYESRLQGYFGYGGP